MEVEKDASAGFAIIRHINPHWNVATRLTRGKGGIMGIWELGRDRHWTSPVFDHLPESRSPDLVPSRVLAPVSVDDVVEVFCTRIYLFLLEFYGVDCEVARGRHLGGYLLEYLSIEGWAREWMREHVLFGRHGKLSNYMPPA
jgi:hypothetical protein